MIQHASTQVGTLLLTIACGLNAGGHMLPSLHSYMRDKRSNMPVNPHQTHQLCNQGDDYVFCYLAQQLGFRACCCTNRIMNSSSPALRAAAPINNNITSTFISPTISPTLMIAKGLEGAVTLPACLLLPSHAWSAVVQLPHLSQPARVLHVHLGASLPAHCLPALPPQLTLLCAAPQLPLSCGQHS